MSSAKLLGGCLAAVFLLFAADKAGVITLRQPPRPPPQATTPGLAPPAAPRPPAPAAVVPIAPAAPPTQDFTPQAETPDALPEGPGRDDTFYRCTACHSTALIRRSGFTRAQWDDLMDWMVQRQNMPPLEPDMRRIVVDYLAEAFPPRRTSPRGGRNPFSE